MHGRHIAELLKPFLRRDLSPEQLGGISMYIDILLKWNRKMNLTAVRRPEELVTRHFGESLFAAQHIFPSVPAEGIDQNTRTASSERDSPESTTKTGVRPLVSTVVDFG